jgi:hypothetical protein
VTLFGWLEAAWKIEAGTHKEKNNFKFIFQEIFYSFCQGALYKRARGGGVRFWKQFWRVPETTTAISHPKSS